VELAETLNYPDYAAGQYRRSLSGDGCRLAAPPPWTGVLGVAAPQNGRLGQYALKD
jgi:hypothetical protein